MSTLHEQEEARANDVKLGEFAQLVLSLLALAGLVAVVLTCMGCSPVAQRAGMKVAARTDLAIKSVDQAADATASAATAYQQLAAQLTYESSALSDKAQESAERITRSIECTAEQAALTVGSYRALAHHVYRWLDPIGWTLVAIGACACIRLLSGAVARWRGM